MKKLIRIAAAALCVCMIAGIAAAESTLGTTDTVTGATTVSHGRGNGPEGRQQDGTGNSQQGPNGFGGGRQQRGKPGAAPQGVNGTTQQPPELPGSSTEETDEETQAQQAPELPENSSDAVSGATQAQGKNGRGGRQQRGKQNTAPQESGTAEAQQPPELPEMPEGMTPPENGQMPEMPEGMTPPENGEAPEMPETEAQDESDEAESPEASAEGQGSGSAPTVQSGNRSSVRMRQEPGKKSRIVGIFSNGTPVEILEVGDEWVKVRIGDKVGYMMLKFIEGDITPSEDSTSTEAAGNNS